LPGEHDGAAAIERAWQDWRDGKIKRTGVMIHYVVAKEGEEGGPAVLLREIPFVKGVDKDIEKLKQRIHQTE